MCFVLFCFFFVLFFEGGTAQENCGASLCQQRKGRLSGSAHSGWSRSDACQFSQRNSCTQGTLNNIVKSIDEMHNISLHQNKRLLSMASLTCWSCWWPVALLLKLAMLRAAPSCTERASSEESSVSNCLSSHAGEEIKKKILSFLFVSFLIMSF